MVAIQDLTPSTALVAHAVIFAAALYGLYCPAANAWFGRTTAADRP